MRYWAWRVDAPPGPAPDIKLFVLYHDPAISPALPHSLGLQKGLLGVVHVFADAGMRGSNDTVIAHELLHTLGATDKYDLASNQPMHPDGFAEPDREPLYPQSLAELMAAAFRFRARRRAHRSRCNTCSSAEDRERDRLEEAMNAAPQAVAASNLACSELTVEVAAVHSFAICN
jgi:hypothetical protein